MCQHVTCLDCAGVCRRFIFSHKFMSLWLLYCIKYLISWLLFRIAWAGTQVCFVDLINHLMSVVSFYFRYLIIALILQLMWSSRLAYKDIFALRNKKDLHTPDNLLIIVMIDWVSRSLYLFYCPWATSEFTEVMHWSNWTQIFFYH